ncbi:hypothetical protein CU044_3866 [Streptomyces sp. L-9-10]|uniref:DUF6274 family protein n=1 Tax=unclassified Streptomyces TaxID=2593676 RepID=UPI00101C5443|nr:DUF6274 family protein [Streptomyces sp. L-9-10]RYJ26155.1 hypothetical protein CU044_3866 [Streptomyces sp. L-9-10]
MTTSKTKHETRALLRAHLAAASGHPHRTGYCPICHRLQRLAMEPSVGDDLFLEDCFLDGELAEGQATSAPCPADCP